MSAKLILGIFPALRVFLSRLTIRNLCPEDYSIAHPLPGEQDPEHNQMLHTVIECRPEATAEAKRSPSLLLRASSINPSDE
ncbi:hypothetical protein ACEN85_02520 [Curtobacterium sp. CT11-45]|uniref:hypothetical protein n=1 Tax=Curtobacterium sp. CT11-45 TaxID=3243037 RepID=UPI0039B06BAF